MLRPILDADYPSYCIKCGYSRIHKNAKVKICNDCWAGLSEEEREEAVEPTVDVNVALAEQIPQVLKKVQERKENMEAVLMQALDETREKQIKELNELKRKRELTWSLTETEAARIKELEAKLIPPKAEEYREVLDRYEERHKNDPVVVDSPIPTASPQEVLHFGMGIEGGGPERTTFATGAQRAKAELPLCMMPPFGQFARAAASGEGAYKYSAYNNLKGFPVSDIISHLIIHLYLYFWGDKSEDHLSHAAWNMDQLLLQANTGIGIDDRPQVDPRIVTSLQRSLDEYNAKMNAAIEKVKASSSQRENPI